MALYSKKEGWKERKRKKEKNLLNPSSLQHIFIQSLERLHTHSQFTGTHIYKVQTQGSLFSSKIILS